MEHSQNLCVTLWQQWYLVGRASSHRLCEGRRCWSAPPPCHNDGFPKQLFKKTILIQRRIRKGFGMFPFLRVQISPVLCSSWLRSGAHQETLHRDQLLQATDASSPRKKGQNDHARFTLVLWGFFVSCFVFFFLTDFFPSIQLGQKCLRFKQLKERPSLQVPSCFGTEFCSWLKFFSFQNTNGHFSWKSGIWPGKEAKCENTAENSMLFFRVVQPAPLMRDHRSLDS